MQPFLKRLNVIVGASSSIMFFVARVSWGQDLAERRQHVQCQLATMGLAVSANDLQTGDVIQADSHLKNEFSVLNNFRENQALLITSIDHLNATMAVRAVSKDKLKIPGEIVRLEPEAVPFAKLQWKKESAATVLFPFLGRSILEQRLIPQSFNNARALWKVWNESTGSVVAMEDGYYFVREIEHGARDVAYLRLLEVEPNSGKLGTAEKDTLVELSFSLNKPIPSPQSIQRVPYLVPILDFEPLESPQLRQHSERLSEFQKGDIFKEGDAYYVVLESREADLRVDHTFSLQKTWEIKIVPIDYEALVGGILVLTPSRIDRKAKTIRYDPSSGESQSMSISFLGKTKIRYLTDFNHGKLADKLIQQITTFKTTSRSASQAPFIVDFVEHLRH